MSTPAANDDERRTMPRHVFVYSLKRSSIQKTIIIDDRSVSSAERIASAAIAAFAPGWALLHHTTTDVNGRTFRHVH